MRKRIISALIACVLFMLSMPCLAKTVSTETADYSFGNAPEVSKVFTGTAVGSTEWKSDSVSDFVSFENQKFVVSSSKKAAFVSLDNKMVSNHFDMTADIGITIENNATDASSGFAFAAGNGGYYKVLFDAEKNVVIAKTNKLTTASGGSSLKKQSVADKLAFDGTSQNIKISLNKKKISVYAGSNLLTEYEPEEEIEAGFFGFVTTKDIKAEYSNFKITRYIDTYTYDESDYVISEYSVKNENSKAVVEWTNPDIDEIKSVKILKEDGTELTSYTGDVSLKANAKNNVSISNISHNVNVGLKVQMYFENHTPIESTIKYVNIPYDENDYKITGFSVEAKTSGAVLKWTNPIVDGIESITITDDKGNTYAKNVSLTGGASNNVTIGGLTGGERYTFTVTARYADKEDSVNGTITAVALEESGYHPKNVLVFETYTRLGISWINPSKSITSINVYDCATGNEAKISDVNTITLESGKVNNILLEDLSSKENANYRIVFNFGDGHEPVEYIAGGLPYGQGKYNDYEQSTSSKISGWDVFYSIQTAKYPVLPADIIIDRNEKASGESSLKFVGSYAKTYDNVFYQLRIKPFNDYNPNYTYKISMKVKYTNAQNSVILAYGNKAMNCYADGTTAPTYNVGTNLTPKKSTDGWETVSYLIKPTDASGNPRSSGLELAVRILNTAEAFWIDDIEMVPVDENGNAIGENILPNGGMETDDHTPCGNVKADKENSNLKNGTATLYWENPDDTQLKNVILSIKAMKKI